MSRKGRLEGDGPLHTKETNAILNLGVWKFLIHAKNLN